MGNALHCDCEPINSKIKITNAGNNPNFDNLTDMGFYYFGSTASAINPPSSSYGYLNMLVIKVHNDYICQVAFGGRQDAGAYIWVRYYNNGTWKNWAKYSPDA